MTIKYYEDLEIWKAARILTKEIYQITKEKPFNYDFGLVNQIRRAAVSVMSNIAEGFERGGNQEFIQFLSIAKGSCGEVRSQLYIALDQGYFGKEEFERILDLAKKVSIMINNFISYLKGSGFRGAKFKKPPYKSMMEEVEGIMKKFEVKKG